MHNWERNAHIYATYEVTGINHAKRSTVHISDIYHETNKASTLQKSLHNQGNIVHGHLDPMLLHTYAKTLSIDISISHMIAKFVPETHVSIK